MSYPTNDITYTHLDDASDSVGLARAELHNALVRLSELIDSRNTTDGIAPLDSSGQVPNANMPTTFTTEDDSAVVGSLFRITVAFTDSADVAVTPDSVTWTFTDENGTVQNSREDVSVDAGDLDTSIEIVVEGSDLVATDNMTRVLIVEAVYDDSVAGDNKTMRDEVSFPLIDLTV